MNVLRLQVYGLWNSFRVPEFHQYQKTIPFPPKTTVLGMCGAAMGKSPEEVGEWLNDDVFQVGICFPVITQSKQHAMQSGYAKDLWRYLKYKSSELINGVVMREVLYNSHFTLYITCSDNQLLQNLADAIEHPKWALSLGREEELILIMENKIISLIKSSEFKFQNVVLPVDAGEYLKPSSLMLEKILNREITSFSQPTVVRLPLEFDYDQKSGIRNGKSYQSFTIIRDFEMEVNPEMQTQFGDIYKDGSYNFMFF